MTREFQKRREKNRPSRMSNDELDANEVKYQVLDCERPGTVFSSYTVMTKSMIGSGILSIAFACSKCGLILGVLLLLFAAGLTWLSLHVLCKLSLAVPSREITFYSITDRILPKVRTLLDIAVIMDCLGSSIAFLQTIGQLLGKCVEQLVGFGFMGPRYGVVLIQVIIVVALFPVCLMREISGTKYLNLIGLGGLVYVALLSIVYTDFSSISTELLYPIDSFSGISGFLIMIFAFSCQQNVLSVCTELKSPSIRKLDIITGSSIGTGFLMYLPVMVLPFLTYGRSNPNAHTFFELLPSTAATNVGYLCAAISVSISYVLVVHPIRRSVMSLMYGCNFPVGRKESVARTSIVSAIMCISLGVAILAGNSLGTTLEFTALLGSTTCGFLMPSILYLKYFGWNKRSVTCWAVAGMLLLCTVLYPLGITSAIMGIVNNTG